MGDMADLVDDTWDWWDLDGDSWGDGSYYRNTGYRPRPKTCHFCKTGNLHWIQVQGRWRLADKTGLPHECNRGITNAIFTSRKETNEHTDGKIAIHQCGDSQFSY